MKTKFKTVALFLVLGTVAVGCQKENLSKDLSRIEQTETNIQVVYSVDGEVFYTVLCGENAWDDFISHMLALAREGHEVTFSRNGRSISIFASKEKVTFITTSEQEAQIWVKKMENDGYTVNVTFDQNTGEYTCVAYK